MAEQNIVVIDDEESMGRLLKIELASEGYNVTLAYDGKVGLQLVKDVKPDLVVLDVMMPEVSGFDVLRKIKQNPETKQIPVIILTAKGLEQDIQKGLDLGANDYITKPFHSALLIKRIKNCLDLTQS